MKSIAGKQGCFLEMRYDEHRGCQVLAQKGRLDQASTSLNAGVGVRALVDGSWGFASTSEMDEAGLKRAVDKAIECARELSKSQREKIPALPAVKLSTEDYSEPGYRELKAMSIEDKIDKVVQTEKSIKARSSLIHTAVARYSENLEKKIIVTSDGACCSRELVRPEFKAAAYAGEGGQQQVAGRGIGVTGGWKCLFNHPSSEKIIEDTAREAVDLLKAVYAPGGRMTVILEPSLVGLLCHEAIGHTVEADFVQTGSVAAGKLGQKVASKLVTLCDSGTPPYDGGPGGFLPFDDEGVPCQTTTIIEKGILKNYLHNRESACRFGTTPNGNARAWGYTDEPLIRMTNTYMLPGTSTLEEMIAGIDDGIYLTGAGGGQADATGEFMFSASSAYEIKKGKLGRMFREVTLSGVAFEVLKTVDAISNSFRWDMGSGYCGKGQPAKVDAGGPYVRCQVMIGGRQA